MLPISFASPPQPHLNLGSSSRFSPANRELPGATSTNPSGGASPVALPGNAGFERYLQKSRGERGGRVLSGKDRKTGAVYGEGQFKGMTQGQADKSTFQQWSAMPEESRDQFRQKNAGDYQAERERAMQAAKDGYSMAMDFQNQIDQKTNPQGGVNPQQGGGTYVGAPLQQQPAPPPQPSPSPTPSPVSLSQPQAPQPQYDTSGINMTGTVVENASGPLLQARQEFANRISQGGMQKDDAKEAQRLGIGQKAFEDFVMKSGAGGEIDMGPFAGSKKEKEKEKKNPSPVEMARR